MKGRPFLRQTKIFGSISLASTKTATRASRVAERIAELEVQEGRVKSRSEKNEAAVQVVVLRHNIHVCRKSPTLMQLSS
jgi:hypothetical protein